ncbi:MAG: sulfate adenylyltransferase, partial [Bacteroidetes bacterium HGW-Bacteroidetes-22]
MTHNPTQGYLDMELLRFTTAGSVDDGKSTLIGRLLYDSKAIFEDQMEAVKSYSLRRGNPDIDLSLFTDGLRSEREQGITIDVAYRYFATPRRKFIIADTPGHIQYTRNMVTGASTANAAIVLIDARNGITEQTRRHCFIASLLRIPYLIVCVNKMDLAGFDQKVYDEILADFNLLRSRLSFNDITFVPISALQGDNVVDKSETMTWYQGSPLLEILETLDIQTGLNYTDSRFPVQYVIRPHDDAYHDYRSYAGRVEGGVFRPGDNVVVLPSGLTSTIEAIDIFQGSLPEAFPPQSVSLRLTDDLDISRGDVIVKKDSLPQVSQEIEVMMCWMNLRP